MERDLAADISYIDSFAKYVEKGQEMVVHLTHMHGVKHVDVISIDGRSRVECARLAISLLKPSGGILILDNSERRAYAEVFRLMPRHWIRYSFKTKVDTTTVWISVNK